MCGRRRAVGPLALAIGFVNSPPAVRQLASAATPEATRTRADIARRLMNWSGVDEVAVAGRETLVRECTVDRRRVAREQAISRSKLC